MSFWLPNGAGETVGDQLASGPNLTVLTTNKVLYVGSTNATDTDNNGEEAQRPLATLTQAQTTGTDYDIVVLRDGFTQTLASSFSITKALIFTGGGSNSGLPTARIGVNLAATAGLVVNPVDVEFRNIYFPAQTQANSAARIELWNARTLFRNCYFECNGNDGLGVIQFRPGANHMRFENCTFVNTATDPASRPGPALFGHAGFSGGFLTIKDCTFDGGTVGWKNAATGGWAIDLTTGSYTLVKLENLSLLRGADVAINSTNPVGWLQVSTITGGSVVRNV